MGLVFSSSSWVPRAAMWSSSRIRISSAYCTEEMRWAIMMMVVSFRFLAKEARMAASVVESTAEVESSRMSTAGFLSMARAMHNLCFCPPDTFTPP